MRNETCELEQIVGHMGILGGYSAGIELYPQRGLALVSLSNHRDAPNRDLIWAARDILLESKALAARSRALSPVLRHAMAALVDLYAHFSEAKYQKVFAALSVDAFPAAEAGREAKRLEKIHGRCKEPTPLEIRNDSSGRFTTLCERGRVEYDVQIDADGRFVDSALSSRDIPPSPAVARAAARVAALIKHWDDAAYDAVLAPALPKPRMRALFDKLRVLHRACTVGAPLEGEGGPSAVVTLDCEAEGPLRLTLTVAAPGERVTQLTINPLFASKSTGKCPER